jgi:hypothetical protein
MIRNSDGAQRNLGGAMRRQAAMAHVTRHSIIRGLRIALRFIRATLLNPRVPLRCTRATAVR